MEGGGPQKRGPRNVGHRILLFFLNWPYSSNMRSERSRVRGAQKRGPQNVGHRILLFFLNWPYSSNMRSERSRVKGGGPKTRATKRGPPNFIIFLNWPYSSNMRSERSRVRGGPKNEGHETWATEFYYFSQIGHIAQIRGQKGQG